MNAPMKVGDLIDFKYRLLRIIGEGGWGIVFEGENTRTLKRVAIKVLRSQANLTDDIVARFEREAQAAGRIGSDHIVEVFDLGTLPDGTRYMVMELLAGEDLATRIKREKQLEPLSTVKLVVQLLDGLGAAHDAGILHRDLKPENLYLIPTRSGDDFVKILDFGISKFSSDGPAASATLTGAVMGSPCYMAPEQARGLKQIDARTDLYSVGTVLFECLTGKVPFMGDNFNDLMFKIVLSPRPSALEFRPDLDPELAKIIAKAITADPAARYATAAEFRKALVDWLEFQGILSVRGPELLQSMRRTPSNEEAKALSASAAAASTPGSTEAPSGQGPLWGEATLPVGSTKLPDGLGPVAIARSEPASAQTPGGPPAVLSRKDATSSGSHGSVTSGTPQQTPISAARSIPQPEAQVGRTKGALLRGVAAAVIVAACVGTFLYARRSEPTPGSGLVTPPSEPATAAVHAAAPPTPEPSAPATPPSAEAPVPSSSAAATPASSTTAPAASVTAATSASAAPHVVHRTPTAPVPAEPTAKRAPAATTAPSAKAPEDKVEGRSYRNEL